MKNAIIIGSIVFLVIIVTGFIKNKRQSAQPIERKTAISDLAVSDTIAESDDLQATKNTKLIPYTPEAFTNATKGDGIAVLFFHASWCPSCRAAEADFRAHMDQIPENVTILMVDYDTETDLKAKYGIVLQDTFVQINALGKAVAKWNSGGQGMQSLLANLQNK